MEELIRNLINQIQDEEEPTNGSEWQSGYNNGLARADELLCELSRTVSGIEMKKNQECEHCEKDFYMEDEDLKALDIIKNNFCPFCGKKLNK